MKFLNFSLLCFTWLTLSLTALPKDVLSGAQGVGFNKWRAELREEAIQNGIQTEIFDQAFHDVQPIPRVVELDRKQPEFTMTFEQYLARVVNSGRITEGKQKLAQHGPLLEEIGKRFGVQPKFIVSLWGIETGFGKHTGGFPVIAALATLAFDGRRSAFFRAELLIALKILGEGHISLDRMKGSWAGAMGQNQFMPSSFWRYAVDYNQDGRRDIWGNEADVFASTANYLSSVGWRNDITWGRAVQLPVNFNLDLTGREIKKKIGDWERIGVRQIGGMRLPTRQLMSSIIIPNGKAKREPAFLIYENFEAILRWNRSNFFALAVGHLADEIAKQ